MQPPESGALLGKAADHGSSKVGRRTTIGSMTLCIFECRSLNHWAAFGYFSKIGTLISLKRLVYVDENHGLMGPKRSELRQSL